VCRTSGTGATSHGIENESDRLDGSSQINGGSVCVDMAFRSKKPGETDGNLVTNRSTIMQARMKNPAMIVPGAMTDRDEKM